MGWQAYLQSQLGKVIDTIHFSSATIQLNYTQKSLLILLLVFSSFCYPFFWLPFSLSLDLVKRNPFKVKFTFQSIHFSSKMKAFFFLKKIKGKERHFVKHTDLFLSCLCEIEVAEGRPSHFTNDGTAEGSRIKRKMRKKGSRFLSGQTFPWSSGPLVAH